jgi:HAD superfamily hydrolase (TIGR01509 family)
MMEDQPARRYRAIFFEMYGTLASGSTDDEAHMHLMESLVERYRIAAEPPLLLKSFIARLSQHDAGTETGWVHHLQLAQRTFTAILADYGLRTGPPDETWFNEEYVRVHQSFVRLLPGAQGVLDEVLGTGLHIGLITDCDTRYLDRQLCWLDIVRYFDSRTTSEEAGAGKPDGRIFRAALKKARCKPQQAIFVGSSMERDICGAKAAGMTTVLLDVGMSRAEIQEADFVASAPGRLAKILVELAYTA